MPKIGAIVQEATLVLAPLSDATTNIIVSVYKFAGVKVHLRQDVNLKTPAVKSMR